MKKLLAVLVALVVAFTAVGCKKAESNSLKITIYLGGYGQVWANTLARDFEAENPGIKVTVETNPELQSEIPARLENGSDDDIFFSHGVAWEKAAVQGYLEPLDDLYEMEVEDGVKFKDRVASNFVESTKFVGKHYKVPWTLGAGGIVYNAKMFRDNGWEVPTTYEELVELADHIYESQIPVDPKDTKPNARKIKPFIWSSETYYWDYLVFDWWAQLAGNEKMREYKALQSAEVINPDTNPELMKAFEAWVNLIAKNPDWSAEDSVGKHYMAAQMDFLNGGAAMLPNAQWLEMEMRDNIDPEVMEMQLMPTPFLKDAKKDANGDPIRVNYAVGGGDSIIIPKNSKNKELAKKFLLFMAREENLLKFTKLTNGVMLAMNYPADASIDDATPFMQSVMEINMNSQKFDLYSNSLLVLEGKMSIEWPPEGIQHYSTYFNYYNTLEYINNPSNYEQKDIYQTFKNSYEVIKNNWKSWNDEIIQ